MSAAQLTDYLSDLIASHSWSAVKLDLCGFKFYTLHVLGKPWAMPHFIRPPKVQRPPDIVTVDEAQRLFWATRTLSSRVFYFTLYSMGLRLSEGLALKVGDVDAARQRVSVRDSCRSNTSGYTTDRYPSTVDSTVLPCQKKYSSFWPPWPP